jgi:glycosyltransferase involved in cell wall biosynthesis
MIRCSLLVPCHNAAGHLPRLWTTVRAQTQSFAELICYDDASTDDTAEVARSLGAKVLCGEINGGPAHARNQLWRAAICDWVHFHDADDLLEPAFLEKMAARAGADTDVVICNARWLREDTREVELEWRYSESELRAAPAPYLLSHPIGGINGLYRRTALQSAGGFNEKLKVWEDADLHVRLALQGARFAVVEEPLVTALRRTDSLSAEMMRNWRSRLTALRHYAQTLPADCTPTLISELEGAARQLLRLGDPASAREALQLVTQLGGDPPTTRNPVLKLCKRLLGPMAALRLQTRVRKT